MGDIVSNLVWGRLHGGYSLAMVSNHPAEEGNSLVDQNEQVTVCLMYIVLVMIVKELYIFGSIIIYLCWWGTP